MKTNNRKKRTKCYLVYIIVYRRLVSVIMGLFIVLVLTHVLFYFVLFVCFRL